MLDENIQELGSYPGEKNENPDNNVSSPVQETSLDNEKNTVRTPQFNHTEGESVIEMESIDTANALLQGLSSTVVLLDTMIIEFNETEKLSSVSKMLTTLLQIKDRMYAVPHQLSHLRKEYDVLENIQKKLAAESVDSDGELLWKLVAQRQTGVVSNLQEELKIKRELLQPNSSATSIRKEYHTADAYVLEQKIGLDIVSLVHDAFTPLNMVKYLQDQALTDLTTAYVRDVKESLNADEKFHTSSEAASSTEEIQEGNDSEFTSAEVESILQVSRGLAISHAKITPEVKVKIHDRLVRVQDMIKKYLLTVEKEWTDTEDTPAHNQSSLGDLQAKITKYYKAMFADTPSVSCAVESTRYGPSDPEEKKKWEEKWNKKIKINEADLIRLLVNLSSNVLKANGLMGEQAVSVPSIEVNVTFAIQRDPTSDNENVVIVFRNTGQPLPPELDDKEFLEGLGGWEDKTAPTDRKGMAHTGRRLKEQGGFLTGKNIHEGENHWTEISVQLPLVKEPETEIVET